MESESRAKDVVAGRSQRQEALRQHALAVASRRVGKPGLVPLKLVLKASTIASLHALNTELSALVNDEVGVHTIHSGVGGITKFDIDMAAAADAMIVGFGVSLPGSVKKQAALQSVEVFQQNVRATQTRPNQRIHGCGLAGCVQGG